MVIQDSTLFTFLNMSKYMYLSLVLFVLIALPALVSCDICSDVQLTERTKRIIDLYIETTDDSDNPIYVCGSSFHGYYVMEILAYSPHPDFHFDGMYCGYTYFRGRKIEVWGDSWNCHFWKQQEEPVLVPEDDNSVSNWEFDPCDWYLTIRKSDFTVIEDECYFTCGVDFPVDTLNSLLKMK